MNDGTTNEVRVSFPASATFSRIGRVAVAGLALRLGVDVADVEKLRLAVDQAVSALHGPGRINLNARWEPDVLTVTIDNPDRALDEGASRDVSASLLGVVDHVHVGSNQIDITLAAVDRSTTR